VHHKDCGVLELKVIQVSSSQHENFEDLLLTSSSHLNGQLTSVGQFLTKHASILGEGSIFWLLCWGAPNVPKILVMGQSNSSFWKRKKQFIFYLDTGQLTFHASFLVFLVAKSSQVLDMFLKEFPIAPHFYPLCFVKCCRPFISIGGPKGRGTVYFKRKPCLLGSLHSSNFLE
jgi:hypothetical protein